MIRSEITPGSNHFSDTGPHGQMGRGGIAKSSAEPREIEGEIAFEVAAIAESRIHLTIEGHLSCRADARVRNGYS